MILIKDLSKNYATRTVLRPVNLKLAQGETHVLIGSSGSGKSTLLRLLCGLIEATTGNVKIDQDDVTPKNQLQLAAKIGYVIQEGGLFPHLTSRENVVLAAKTLGWSKSKIAARLIELAHLVQLEESLLARYPKELSGGQRQRVALMRALMLDPPLLLLDEPLGALDPLVRSDLQKELKRIFIHVKKTVVMVTHDVGEAAFFGHTISLFHDGYLVQHGEFSSFVKKPASEFVTRFIRAQTPPPELLAELVGLAK